MRKFSLFVAMILWMASACFYAEADTISVSDESGCMGDQVTFEISISNPTTPVDAFGFRINFDTTALDYVNCSRGPLDPGWVFFNCNESGGQIIIGGMAMSAIPAGSQGVIANLTFNVLCSACTQGQTFSITLTNLVDDLAAFTADNGVFTFTCPQSPTPTVTQTSTATQTLTPTQTETPTQTFTSSPTETPAETETPNSTETPTLTATPTLTPEATNTPENTQTPVSPTESPSSTSTTPATDTPIPTETPLLDVPATGPMGFTILAMVFTLLIGIAAGRSKHQG